MGRSPIASRVCDRSLEASGARR